MLQQKQTRWTRHVAVAVALLSLLNGCSAADDSDLSSTLTEQEQARLVAAEEFGNLRLIYIAQNTFFDVAGLNHHGTYDWGVWSPIVLPAEPINPFGRMQFVQAFVHASAIDGGTGLTYEILEEYFAHEFEPDGTLRLWVNGRHPEMEAFILWLGYTRTSGIRPITSEYPQRAAVRDLAIHYQELIIGTLAQYPAYSGRGCPVSYDSNVSGSWLNVFDFLSPMELAELERWHREPGTELDLVGVWRAYPELLHMSVVFPCP
ncbi:MAG: hypothetical protein FWD83_04375 [Promicromonosporaceae bacterium]|nr:hypothetical protein [Promicromonosporaceae bacterium]